MNDGHCHCSLLRFHAVLSALVLDTIVSVYVMKMFKCFLLAQRSSSFEVQGCIIWTNTFLSAILTKFNSRIVFKYITVLDYIQVCITEDIKTVYSKY